LLSRHNCLGHAYRWGSQSVQTEHPGWRVSPPLGPVVSMILSITCQATILPAIYRVQTMPPATSRILPHRRIFRLKGGDTSIAQHSSDSSASHQINSLWRVRNSGRRCSTMTCYQCHTIVKTKRLHFHGIPSQVNGINIRARDKINVTNPGSRTRKGARPS